MNVSPGGVVPSMRSIIFPKIGIYPSIYSIGDKQKNTDNGTFWLAPEDKRLKNIM